MRICLLFISIWIALIGTAHAGSVWLPGSGFGGIDVAPIQSLDERKFSRTVRQQYDFSCGSAAVSTLLTFQYQDPVSEKSIFQSMWERGDQEKIRVEGFSLLDIKNYLESRGYTADGYDVPLDRLVQASVPAIMLISDHGYNHFVVVKGISEDRILLGDPSKGARIIPLEDFKKMLVTPIIFVITNHDKPIVFNGQADWATKPLAPLETAVTAGRLATESVFLRPVPGAF
ncbi:C39 family peptidase [Alcaligenaceae bacterium]|nr:C39 family peptidase [Alcaligenaceae bacterium]